jgi:S-DNA-T family DNA segregation ATPase FtsK/SpoIIIE
LLGLALVGLALAVTLMLWTYTPEDPGWMVATNEPARNLMGRFGAAVSSTLVIICGRGAWAVPLILLIWGVRFVIHRGEDRAMGRTIFAVIAVAMASVFASTHVPGADWTHSFGLGGLFGDTIVGALLGLLPFGAAFSLKLLSVLSGIAVIAMGLYVTGFEKSELRAILRFLVIGVIRTYDQALTWAGRGASETARAAQALKDRRQARREAGYIEEPPVEQPAVTGGAATSSWTSRLRDAHAARQSGDLRPEPLVASSRVAPPRSQLRADIRYAPEPVLVEEPAGVATLARAAGLAAGPVLAAPARALAGAAAPRPRGGLLAKMPQLMRRVIEPELAEPVLTLRAEAAEGPSEDRIRARISDAIRLRATARPTVDVSTPGPRAEPPVLARPAAAAPAPARAIAPLAAAPFDALAEDDLDDAGWEAAQGYALEGDETEVMEDYIDEAPAAQRLGQSPVAPDLRRPVVQHPAKKPVAPSRQAVQEAQPRLRFDDPAPAYEPPPLSLLTAPQAVTRSHQSAESLEENARMLESVLDDYGVKGEIVSVRPGPVVTMYELEPAPGLKASRVIGLADDIARSMSALSARVSTVPGRSVIGIELPNAHREKVVLREILSARDFGDSNMRLPLALGKDIGGDPVVANLAKMPHLLIAGTTGSGKSVAINTMILSLLYKLTPEECRLIMIDPKMLELSVYDGIPHLLSPVVTDPKKAVVALKWVVGEMEERYRKMSRMGVRNIEGYNGRVREALAKGEMFKRTIQTGFDDETGDPVFETEEFAPVALPYIVVIVDEMADLMMVAGKEIEACIQRLAQMARASGIHLIMATQRPSVDVITGTIKANFPTRISFQVTSKIDSRTILGEQGAEQLLGMGDMLYMAGGARITRIHGPFVSDEEVEEIVNHLKSFGPPEYMSGVVEGVDDEKADDIDLVLGLGGGDGGDDALYDQAVAIVAKDRKCSTSYIQRKLGIGYNKAARLVEQMEEQGVVTPANHVGKREILLPEH